jgi:4-amino-4-deoxy-L-arabinose transferase-like glycosyltransferase
MSSAEQTSALGGQPALAAEPEIRTLPRRGARVLPQHLALAGVLTLSAVLNVHRLAENEYGNTFYAAAVKSMLRSWHNFFFVSFDPGGLITVDKPPLALWVQGTSAAVFGFHPLSLLLPQAIMGVITVAAVYWIVTPRFGPAAGVISALALAVYPSFVAISRENGVDSVLILLMTLACGVGLRAIESGRLRTLIGCAALVGLAFNAKTLAAYLILPGLLLGYLACAPVPFLKRCWQLLAAGAVLVAVSASWSLAVELTPASQRPFVGGSTDNTEHNLTFDYNGLGRVEGQVGGPGQIPILVKHGSLAHIEHEALRLRAQRAAGAHGGTGAGPPAPTAIVPAIPPRPAHAPKPKPPPAFLPNGRAHNPTAFGGPTGPLRLLKVELGGQAGWMLPFAFFGLIALVLWSFLGGTSSPPRARGRAAQVRLGFDRMRLAALIVLGGWFLVEAVVLSFGKGIVHPYYVSALGPGAAAMIGGGAVAFIAPGRWRAPRLALLPIAVATTVIAQLRLLEDDSYMRWFWPILIAGAALGVAALLVLALVGRGSSGVSPGARLAMALTLGLLLIAPGAYAATTWEFPVEGTFPAAGPHAAGSLGPLGVDQPALRVTKALIAYVDAHHPGTRWDVLTEASDTAAPMILLGHDAGAMGGYSGNDPALDGSGLARLVELGEARYVVLGGAYAERGGNAATNAVIAACEVIPAVAWQPRPVNPNALLLYDCAGHERALRAS